MQHKNTRETKLRKFISQDRKVHVRQQVKSSIQRNKQVTKDKTLEKEAVSIQGTLLGIQSSARDHMVRESHSTVIS